jgi:aldose 1-epimerase
VSSTTPRILGRVALGTTFGHGTEGPTDVEAIGFGRADGLAATVLTYGGHLTEVLVPDRRGRRANVVLRLPDLAAYQDRSRNSYLGALVGRYANRIAAARFRLDGVEHRLAPNEGPNQLHGGPIGFDRHVWEASTSEDDEGADVVLRLTSPEGDQGFPGTLRVEARYRIDVHDQLTISFEAITDAPTVVSLTNHAYWNLAGGGPVTNHLLQVVARSYLEADDEGIPTGRVLPVRGTRFDHRGGRPVQPHLDHCLVLDPADPQVVLIDPGSGRRLRLRTDQPGLQVYSAAGLADPHTAVCLETQQFPDAPNHEQFPSAALRPGERFRATTVIGFDTR